MEHALKFLGQSEVWLTTFSVSEEFLRRFHFLSKDLVVSAKVILDYKGAQKTLKLWNFISAVFSESFMADNHSKVFLARSVQKKTPLTVAVITSQNLTRGNRFESSLITTDPAIFASLLADWQEIAQKNSIPLDELLGSTAAGDSGIRLGLSHDL